MITAHVCRAGGAGSLHKVPGTQTVHFEELTDELQPYSITRGVVSIQHVIKQPDGTRNLVLWSGEHNINCHLIKGTETLLNLLIASFVLEMLCSAHFDITQAHQIIFLQVRSLRVRYGHVAIELFPKTIVPGPYCTLRQYQGREHVTSITSANIRTPNLKQDHKVFISQLFRVITANVSTQLKYMQLMTLEFHCDGGQS